MASRRRLEASRFAALILGLILVATFSGTVAAAGITLTATDRLLVIAPHPDDETLGAGGIIQMAQQERVPIRVVVVTNGDGSTPAAGKLSGTASVNVASRIKLGNTRQAESLAAMSILGVNRESVQFLGYPDKSLSALWNDNWRAAFYSTALAANSNVYKSVRSPHALFTGSAVRDDMVGIMREFRPTVILVPSQLDMHPDHRAAALFAQLASMEVPGPRPRLYAYIVHRGSWPNVGESLQVPESTLPSGVEWASLPLKQEWVAKKAEAIKLYKTQMAVSPIYLQSFAKSNELFAEIKEMRLNGAEVLVSRESEIRASLRDIAVDHEQILKVKSPGVWHLLARTDGNTLYARVTAVAPELAPSEYTFLLREGDRYLRVTTDQPSVSIPLKGTKFFLSALVSDSQGHVMALPWVACERILPALEPPVSAPPPTPAPTTPTSTPAPAPVSNPTASPVNAPSTK